MSPVLQDKVAIITGAGRGIGRAFALRFAEEGATGRGGRAFERLRAGLVEHFVEALVQIRQPAGDLRERVAENADQGARARRRLALHARLRQGDGSPRRPLKCPRMPPDTWRSRIF